MVNKFKHLKSNWAIFGVIFALSLFLVLPQLLNHSLVLGGDSLFHFNRIYDTYMQFKIGNYSYFQSNYGFQQSGRVVNALYGPGMAYLLGSSLLVLQSWIKFEVVTSFFIFFVSGYSMYFLSRELNSTKKISLLTASLFMGSFYVTRWSIDQNFMTWGVMLMPLIVLIGIKMIKNNAQDLKILSLTLIVSLIIQIHLLSALMSIGVLGVFFIIGFIQTNQKLQLFLKCLFASLLSLVLTFNVWGSMLDIFTTNKLYTTFAHVNMSSSTMNLSTANYSPSQIGLVMSLIFILQIVLLFSKWYEISLANKTVTILGIFFLILTSSLVPWNRLAVLIPPLQNFLQFPFRFDSFATVLLLAGFGATISTISLPGAIKNGELFLIIGSIFILGQSYIDIQHQNEIWNSDSPVAYKGSIVFSNHPNKKQIKRAFTDNDLSKGLILAKKIAPDYLPNNNSKKIDFHNNTYIKDVIMHQPNVIKTVTDKGNLNLKWVAAKKGEKISLPIVLYSNSEITLNGKKLRTQDIKLSSLSSPTVKSTQKGINTLTLGYHSKIITKTSLTTVILTWIISILAAITLTFKKSKKEIS
ncbi:MFS transporter [Dellaglioa algida]|uniref:Cell division protein n=1 Tax=Dellaglioa algida TaxID=105612 RepID=A0A5C6ME06_9LACO|nr:MFS transporter [Dellaglioa algida]MDK1717118.1 MFS transporter [Dellaglioa algida]MDK1719812.1 MFS transporter [Dellaglioa algida]MDK1722060.1 MFS transporter [Dellaglioa algida]MDK1723155.1 MFS transporter [Dellaglioa algida]MDK1739893.1 MFS transporter [Dellaglioa algida]